MNLSLDEIKNEFIFLEAEEHELSIANFSEAQKNKILVRSP